jgi:hypothetical protein
MKRMTYFVLLAALVGCLGVLLLVSTASAGPSATPRATGGVAPPWFTPAQRAAFVKLLPPPLNCTVSLSTVVAGPGTKLSDCIATDPNIPHPVSASGPQAAAFPKTYADGSPTMDCPSWGPQGGFQVVPEGTKLCPTPAGVAPLTAAQIKGAFTAP